MDLKRYPVNQFDTSKISDDNFKKFSEIAAQRFIANNPGSIYDVIIADISVAHTDYYGAITDEDVKTAIKEGSTIAVNGALKLFKETVSQKEGIVRGTYGADSPTYQEFFPHGITEYSNATLKTAETLMDRMVSRSTAHVAELTAAFVTLFTNLKTSFLAKRDAQLLLMGEVKGKKEATAANRNVLEVVLMKAVLTVAINNIGNPAAIDIYFDQSFLKPASQKTFSGKIPVLKTITVDSRKYTNEQEIKLYNNGNGVLAISLSAEKEVTGAVCVKLNPHEERTVTASELGDVNTCKYLNVENQDADFDGDYKIVVYL